VVAAGNDHGEQPGIDRRFACHADLERRAGVRPAAGVG